jgi:hypothetical protein
MAARAHETPDPACVPDAIFGARLEMLLSLPCFLIAFSILNFELTLKIDSMNLIFCKKYEPEGSPATVQATAFVGQLQVLGMTAFKDIKNSK